MKLAKTITRTVLLSAIMLTFAAPLAAQVSTRATAATTSAGQEAQAVSPEAQAVLDRMAVYLQSLETFSVETNASRDEVVAFGYKIQNNEHSKIVVKRPDKLRAEVSGDIRDRTFVYDGNKLTMYSPDDAAFVRIDAPDKLGGLIETLLDIGVEMPLIDVLYQGIAGTLSEGATGGVLVGETMIDGVACDQLAFRQPTIDWQIWVEKGARPLPRKIVITTRYEVGAPQYQANLRWDLKPRIHSSTFEFAPPKGASEIPLAAAANAEQGNP